MTTYYRTAHWSEEDLAGLEKRWVEAFRKLKEAFPGEGQDGGDEIQEDGSDSWASEDYDDLSDEDENYESGEDEEGGSAAGRRDGKARGQSGQRRKRSAASDRAGRPTPRKLPKAEFRRPRISMNSPKQHFIRHMVHWIKNFGNPTFWDAGPNESYHKVEVKEGSNYTNNKADLEKQLLAKSGMRHMAESVAIQQASRDHEEEDREEEDGEEEDREEEGLGSDGEQGTPAEAVPAESPSYKKSTHWQKFAASVKERLLRSRRLSPGEVDGILADIKERVIPLRVAERCGLFGSEQPPRGASGSAAENAWLRWRASREPDMAKRVSERILEIKVHNKLRLPVREDGRLMSGPVHAASGRYDFIEVETTSGKEIRQALIIYTLKLDIKGLKLGPTEQEEPTLQEAVAKRKKTVKMKGMVVRNLFSPKAEDVRRVLGMKTNERLLASTRKVLHLGQDALYKYGSNGRLGYDVVEWGAVRRVAYVVPRWGLTNATRKDYMARPPLYEWGTPDDWVWDWRKSDVFFCHDDRPSAFHHGLKEDDRPDLKL